MPTYIVLLRAVNVGGTGKLPMATFRKVLEDLGCRNVATYIQSGNAVLDATGSSAKVSEKIAAALLKEMGKPCDVVIRTRAEIERVIAGNPYAVEAVADGARVHAVFLPGHAAKDATKGLDSIVAQYPTRRDRYHLAGDTLYLHLPDGAGESKLTGKALERALGVAGTARNWNTVLKLFAMSER